MRQPKVKFAEKPQNIVNLRLQDEKTKNTQASLFFPHLHEEQPRQNLFLHLSTKRGENIRREKKNISPVAETSFVQLITNK